MVILEVVFEFMERNLKKWKILTKIEHLSENVETSKIIYSRPSLNVIGYSDMQESGAF